MEFPLFLALDRLLGIRLEGVWVASIRLFSAIAIADLGARLQIYKMICPILIEAIVAIV